MKKILALPLVCALTACGGMPGLNPGEDMVVDSELTTITKDRFECDVFADRVPLVSSKYATYLKGGSDSTRQKAYESLSRLPDEVLEFVFTRFKTPVSLSSGGGGVCYFSWTTIDGKKVRKPTRISTSTWALNHEMGHASAGVIELNTDGFQDRKGEVYDYAVRKRNETSHMGSYAQTQAEEMFAEAFDSWYCSQQARDYMKQHMPTVHGLAEKWFVKPVGATTVQPQSAKIYMALEETSPNGDDSHYIFFGPEPGIDPASIQYCMSTRAECINANSWASATSLGALPSGVSLFSTNTRIELTAGLHVTAKGRLKDGSQDVFTEIVLSQ